MYRYWLTMYSYLDIFMICVYVFWQNRRIVTLPVRYMSYSYRLTLKVQWSFTIYTFDRFPLPSESIWWRKTHILHDSLVHQWGDYLRLHPSIWYILKKRNLLIFPDRNGDQLILVCDAFVSNSNDRLPDRKEGTVLRRWVHRSHTSLVCRDTLRRIEKEGIPGVTRWDRV